MPKGIYARKTTDPAIRFWARVDRNGPVPDYAPELGPCWLWDHPATDGYGRFNRGSKVLVSAHRFAYELLVGRVPDGLTLDHLCRVRACVNPAHLEPVSLEENTRRGFSPTAINGRKTHCVHGHEYTPENTYVDKRGMRDCLACRNRRNRARYGPRK